MLLCAISDIANLSAAFLDSGHIRMDSSTCLPFVNVVSPTTPPNVAWEVVGIKRPVTSIVLEKRVCGFSMQ